MEDETDTHTRLKGMIPPLVAAAAETQDAVCSMLSMYITILFRGSSIFFKVCLLYISRCMGF